MQKNAAMEANFRPQRRDLWPHCAKDIAETRHFSSNYRPAVSGKLSAFSNAAVTAAALWLPTGEVGV
jgi:hypothetical protein